MTAITVDRHTGLQLPLNFSRLAKMLVSSRTPCWLPTKPPAVSISLCDLLRPSRFIKYTARTTITPRASRRLDEMEQECPGSFHASKDSPGAGLLNWSSVTRQAYVMSVSPSFYGTINSLAGALFRLAQTVNGLQREPYYRTEALSESRLRVKMEAIRPLYWHCFDRDIIHIG